MWGTWSSYWVAEKVVETVDRTRGEDCSASDSGRDFHEGLLGSLRTAFYNERWKDCDTSDAGQILHRIEVEMSTGTKYTGKVRVAGWARRLAECEKADFGRLQRTHKSASKRNESCGTVERTAELNEGRMTWQT